MIIVIALGLLILGFGGRWLKKRHDRKRDQNRLGFNAGITSRSAPVTEDKAGVSGGTAGAAALGPGSIADSPARTRDAFMPYGYGYTRSESRNHTGRESPVTRGGTPFEEMEKGAPRAVSPSDSAVGGGVAGKMRRVLVREKSVR